jgi:hypothetical protein
VPRSFFPFLSPTFPSARPLKAIARSGWLWCAALLVLAVSALCFPATGAAGVALLTIVALLGAAGGGRAVGLIARLPGWAADVSIVAVMLTSSARTFGKPWQVGGMSIQDWGPHHANLSHLVAALREGRVPRWVQGVSTGDSPYELYPFLPYYLAAKAAIWANVDDLTLVLVRSGIVIHCASALGAALLARRVVSWPWALGVGFLTLFDVGSVWGGGAEGTLAMGVTHSALSNAVWTFVLIAVLAGLKRPRLATTLLVWGLVALAVSCHPLGVVCALATTMALLLVALLARDIPSQRPLAMALHVSIGTLLVAFAWMPLSARLTLYGVHFALGGKLAWGAFGHMLAAPVPEASVAALVYAGYLGAVVALLSRRAAPTLLACFAGVLAAGLFDQAYTLADLVPSLETARFQTVRLASSAKASLFVMAAYLMSVAVQALRPAPSEPTPESPAPSPLRARGAAAQRALGALYALLLFGVLRGAVPFFDRLSSDLRGFAHLGVPDEAGLRELATWAREQNSRERPEAFGRLLHEDNRRFYSVYHVNAESGLPTLWVGPVSALFLRERIEDASPASLRRFNVRWVMRRDQPPSLGDPTTERRFGRYFVRELAEWDGHFARIEQGRGQVVVRRLEDERVEVDLEGTDEPALVALGMGYYPRWQVEHADRGPLPTYAMPSFPGADLHVLAAWLPPGHSTFRPSGSLPSDGQGRVPAALGALLAVTGLASCARRYPARSLRALARGKRWLQRHAGELTGAAVGVTAALALGLGYRAARAPARSLSIGNALIGAAHVRARNVDGNWRQCAYSVLAGAYRCNGPVLVQDTVADLLNDAPPSPPFAVPAIHVSAYDRDVEVEIQIDARLSGEYWAATSSGNVTLAVEGQPETQLSPRQRTLAFESRGEASRVSISARVAANQALDLAVVQRRAIEPDRGYVEPPAQPPF